MSNTSNKEYLTKSDVDQKLWQEALVLDHAVYAYPLRGSNGLSLRAKEHITSGLIAPDLKLEPLSLMSDTLSHRERNRTAFQSLPDGSAKTFTKLEYLAQQSDLPFDQVLDLLHALGTSGYLNEMLAPMSVIRLFQNGVKTQDIPGNHRRLTSGFEYGVFNSSHPDVISLEMNFLGKKADKVAKDIKKGITADPSQIAQLRDSLSQSRFCTPERVAHFTDTELLAYLAASETQRISAYIHPWYERVGRTTEEGMGVFALRAGVTPLFLSTPSNRSTLAGYERGIVNAITAVGVLRQIGRNLGISEDQVGSINNVYELYNQLPLPGFKKAIYKTPLRFVLGRNIFPDEEVMKKYYQQTHSIIMGLIDTFDINELIKDPYSVYTTGHLIGRGIAYEE